MKFKYQAKSKEGKLFEGEVSAAAQADAVIQLQNKGMQVVSMTSIKESGMSIDISGINSFLSTFDRASLKDVVNFSNQVAALLSAGVSVIKTFQLVSEDTTKPLMVKTFANIIEDIRGGESVSMALSKHPKVFNDFYVNMVRSGEESGKMSAAFAYLAEYLDRSYTLTSKVKNAMIYPAFVVVVFVVVMILVFTLVIPKLAVILQDSNVELPILTKIVLAISDFLTSYGIYVLLAMVIGGLYAYVQIKDTDTLTETIDTLKIKTPIIKNIYKTLYVNRIADNIETLLGSGVSLTKSLQITADVVGNRYYKNLLERALVDVRAGISLSQSLGQDKELMPSTVVQMIKIGEETGEIGKLMGNVARFYQKEVNATIDTLVSLIEPAMIVLLGLGVGLLLVSVLMPIYNLAGAF
jgi:type IV pilus assembly protein PilC